MTTLRPATSADLPGISDVFWECWTRSYAAFAPARDLARLTRTDADRLWDGVLERGSTVIAVDESNVVTGVLRFEVDTDRLAVHSLYVHPEAQGQGLGGRLLDEAEVAAGDVAGSDLWLFTDNAAARTFYGRRGWLPDGASRVESAFGMPETRLTRTRPGRAAHVLVGRGVCIGDAEQPPAGAVVGSWSPDSTEGTRVWAAGSRDTAGGPMEVDTVHDLASVTKLVTTCALMALVSQGRLDLDCPISQHVPWSGEDPTVRQLLQHRAGLLPWQPFHHVARRSADVIALVPRLPRGGPVGSAFAYSDLSFITLGAVVEALTGHPLDVALSELVIHPLGLGLHYRPRFDAQGDDQAVAVSALDESWEERMIATGEPYPVHVEPDPALPVVVRRPGPIRGSVHDANAFHAMGGVSGHAGLFGTVPDLVGLGRAVLDTSHGLWGDDEVEEFTTPGPDALQGLGFRIKPLRHGRLAWHPGFTGTAVGVRLDAAPAVVAMCTNRHLHDGEPVPTDRLWERALQAELHDEPLSRSTHTDSHTGLDSDSDSDSSLPNRTEVPT
ncbi:GNAT family N-acetyltransferase [Knoellia sp. S7-12]|uniref:GNAT family N-acetyltransferase n=1 Tax=Knoellia sp. S7-12 TaxID=3126698 RepID=UPI0033693449